MARDAELGGRLVRGETWRRRLSVLTVLSVLSVPSSAQTGLVVVAHGADSAWNGEVRRVLDSLRWTDGPTALAFLMGPESATSGWDAGVASVVARGARRLVVVPLMVSSWGGHTRQIQYYAGARDALPPGLAGHAHHATRPPVPALVTPALDGAPELVDAVVARWRALAAADRRRAVMLVAHGPNDAEDAEHWCGDLDRVGQGLRAAGLSAEWRTGLLRDDAPKDVRAASVGAMRDTIAALAARSADSVVIMPVLISTGIERTRLPRDFAGLPVRYSGEPLAPLGQLARWIERVAREATRVP